MHTPQHLELLVQIMRLAGIEIQRVSLHWFACYIRDSSASAAPSANCLGLAQSLKSKTLMEDFILVCSLDLSESWPGSAKHKKLLNIQAIGISDVTLVFCVGLILRGNPQRPECF